MKVDACLIIKNEEKTISTVIDNLLKFCRFIYLVDTGSTDKTIEIIQKYMTLHDNVILDHFDWINDFSVARNYSYSLSKDSDYIFYCDGDELATPELIERLKQFSSLEYNDNMASGYVIPLHQHVTEDSPVTISRRTSLCKTKLHIKWVGQIHEYLDLYDHELDFEYFKDVWNDHVYYRKERDDYRNVNIFKTIKSIDARFLYYYGKELLDLGHELPALVMMLECIFCDKVISNANKVDAAYTYICYIKNEKWLDLSRRPKEVVEYLDNNKIWNKTVFQFFGDYFLEHHKYELAIKYSLKAFNLKYDECIHHSITKDVYDETHCLFNVVVALDKLGRYKESYMYNEMILDIEPNNEIALGNKQYLKTVI